MDKLLSLHSEGNGGNVEQLERTMYLLFMGALKKTIVNKQWR